MLAILGIPGIHRTEGFKEPDVVALLIVLPSLFPLIAFLLTRRAVSTGDV
jgi:hypothetical protein